MAYSREPYDRSRQTKDHDPRRGGDRDGRLRRDDAAARSNRDGHDRTRDDRYDDRASDQRTRRRDRSSRSRSPVRRSDDPQSQRRRSPPRGPKADHARRPQYGDRSPMSPRQPPDAHMRDAPKASVRSVGSMVPDTTPIDPDEDPETTAMRLLLGFGSFRSTKNTKVPGNDKNFAVYKPKKIEYRQYMNRVGGFNRPLSPSHD